MSDHEDRILELDCAEARAALWPADRDVRPLSGARARAHVDDCERCQEYVTLDPILLEAYARLRGQVAPPEVRGRVDGALRVVEDVVGPSSEGTGTSSWRASALAGTLLAAAMVGALVLGVDRAPVASEAQAAFMMDYLRRATAGEHINTSDPREVAAFLESRLGVELEPLDAEGLIVEGAEVCLLDGQLGALILYKQNGVVLSHYLIPHSAATPRPPSIARFRVERDMAAGSEVNLVTWASPSLEQALVGQAPGSRMVELARLAASRS